MASNKGRMCFRLADTDYMPNPLLGLSRNLSCPCGSGLKFKKCCKLLVTRFIRKDYVETYKDFAQRAEAGESPLW